MVKPSPLAELTASQRRDFCHQVLESLSDLVEGTAPDAWQARVRQLLGESKDFRALCDTLKEVVRLAGECGDEAVAGIDEGTFEDAVARVREQLLRNDTRRS